MRRDISQIFVYYPQEKSKSPKQRVPSFKIRMNLINMYVILNLFHGFKGFPCYKFKENILQLSDCNVKYRIFLDILLCVALIIETEIDNFANCICKHTFHQKLFFGVT